MMLSDLKFHQEDQYFHKPGGKTEVFMKRTSNLKTLEGKWKY